jgi:UDP-N-acetylmuramoyl-L-alanyl-D-glutamate--2,6-diaminopimelate ligase
MGRVAGELADLAVLTSDNPRSEDPMQIIAAVERGLADAGGEYRVEPDRRAAVRLAVELAAAEGAALLIAGKGDEAVQIVGGDELSFKDHDEAVAALRERYGAA